MSEHSKAQVIVVEGNKQLAKYANLASPLPHLKAIVVYDEAVVLAIASKVSVPVYSWADFLALGTSVVNMLLNYYFCSVYVVFLMNFNETRVTVQWILEAIKLSPEIVQRSSTLRAPPVRRRLR